MNNMDNLVGLSLRDGLSLIQDKYDKIINIRKITCKKPRFNVLSNPFIIKYEFYDDYITLYISYY